MTNLCEINLKLPNFGAASEKIKAELPGLIAATLQAQRGMIFDTEGRYNGRPGWSPLKCREGQPLKDTGVLAMSIAPINDGIHPGHRSGSIVRLSNELVTIGTDIAYAIIQNNGGVIKPVKAKALRIPCFDGYIFSKKAVIPARVFNDITDQDVEELSDTISNYIAATIRGV